MRMSGWAAAEAAWGLGDGVGSSDVTGHKETGSEGQAAGQGRFPGGWCCSVVTWRLIPRFVFQDIEWTHIDYFNNAIICDLIENVSVRTVFSISR